MSEIRIEAVYTAVVSTSETWNLELQTPNISRFEADEKDTYESLFRNMVDLLNFLAEMLPMIGSLVSNAFTYLQY